MAVEPKGPKQPSKNQQKADEVGYGLAFMKSEPELWALFQKAVKQNFTPSMFEAEYKSTKYYKDHTAAYRTADEKRVGDNATWLQDVAKQKESLQDMSAKMGANLSDKVLSKMANDTLLYGWSPDQLQDKLAKFVEVQGETGHYGGEAGINEDALRRLGMDYGQRISSSSLQKWVVNMARGEATVNDFKAEMQKQAETRYPPYKEQVRKGMTMRQIADPYIEQMAATLELNPENIDLFDSHIQGVLTGPNADSNKQGETNTYDFGRQLRQDPRWLRTKNAQDRSMSVTTKLLQDWGFSG